MHFYSTVLLDFLGLNALQGDTSSGFSSRHSNGGKLPTVTSAEESTLASAAYLTWVPD